ncbi:MAG: DUF362 domain-containing protein [Oscillospiraceae bacterium]|nr:DUF362 domain-containing protein [Oscillospiraceae bacterium]
MQQVSVVPCGNYEAGECERALVQALEPLGGLDWVQPGMCIVIKANLVGALSPDKAATTHPTLLASLTKLLKVRGARVIIGDSPGGLYNISFLKKVYKLTGMEEAVAAGAELNYDFSQKEASFPQGRVSKSFLYTAYLDQADAIISFCKLKTHGMMGLSAATKNLFGAVPGTTKPEYHFRYPEPPDFAGMIVDLNSYFKPKLFLVDAVVAMEGNGPTAGTPRPVGALLAGTDCHKLDMLCAKVIGVDPMSVPTLRAAADFGLVEERLRDEDVAGDVTPFILPDFRRIQQTKSTQFKNVLPGKFGQLFGTVAKVCLQSKPKLKNSACVGCGHCAKICPAKAIKIKNRKAVIHRRSCIRCFCCQEFCPVGAMEVARPIVAKLLNR